MMARTAVVILNWNGEQLLARFLPSVVLHTPPDVDIVVADNGSTDSSIKYLNDSFSERVSVVALDRNYGFAEGYNRALAQLDHNYFILLNSDVEVVAGWCEPLIATLSDDSVGAVAPKILSAQQRDRFDYAGAAGGFIDYLGYPFCRGRVGNRVECDRGQYNSSVNIFWASGAAFSCRASYFREIGGFDADFFAHMEEIDLCWRMQLAGWRIVVEPKSVVYHLGGATLNSGSAQKVYLNHRNNLIMLYKCASLSQLIAVALFRPLLDLAAAALYTVQGRLDQSCAVFRAWWSFITTLPSTHHKRQKIQRGAISKPKGIFKGSILLSARCRSESEDMK